MKKINLYYQTPVTLKSRTRLKVQIDEIFRIEKTRYEHVSIIFCSDKYLLGLNRDFLKHDYYTDIITFPLNSPGQPIEAEIYISADRVRDNARRLGESLQKELSRVVFHGILHLCGYADKLPKQQSQMIKKEEEYLAKFSNI